MFRLQILESTDLLQKKEVLLDVIYKGIY